MGGKADLVPASGTSACATPKQILLIDSNEGRRARLTEHFRRCGHVVVEHADPDDLPPLAELGSIAALVMCRELPHEDGIAFADRFHAVQPGVPVVLIAGAWSKALARESGMRSFMWLRADPIDTDELHGMVDCWCRLGRTGESS